MRPHLKLLFGLAVLLLPLGLVALAQEGYDLTWWTIDGGGTTSEGGGYTLSGTIGQADAGLLKGGGYTLGGGFWKGGDVVSPVHGVYLPCVLRTH